METIESCPSCDEKMELKDLAKELHYKGVDISVVGQVYVCPGCEMEVGTAGHVGGLQKAISNAYRIKVGLLSGEEIRDKRKSLGISQKALAHRMTVGIASIKRWEGSQVQSLAMDKALRVALWEKETANNYLGNRAFSLARIKLVLERFNNGIKENLLINGEKLLKSAKYLWYADFVAYREHGRGMTGATYAALPYGPQLNNYKELNDPIWAADSGAAEPLNSEEQKIIDNICKVFPTSQSVYDAAHVEHVWEKRTIGELMPYSDSEELTKI